MTLLQINPVSPRFDTELARRHDVARLRLAADRERPVEDHAAEIETIVTAAHRASVAR